MSGGQSFPGLLRLADFGVPIPHEGIVIGRKDGRVTMFVGDTEYIMRVIDGCPFGENPEEEYEWSEPFDRPENRAVAYDLLIEFKAWVVAVPVGHRPAPGAVSAMLAMLESEHKRGLR